MFEIFETFEISNYLHCASRTAAEKNGSVQQLTKGSVSLWKGSVSLWKTSGKKREFQPVEKRECQPLENKGSVTL